MVQSNDNADCVDNDDRFKYVDDLSILEVLCLTGFLIEYETQHHVPPILELTRCILVRGGKTKLNMK